MKDKWERAYDDYQNGMKYADIAKKYDVSISAVKMRASREWKNKKVTKSQQKSQSPPRGKGGQQGNENTVKHGVYKKVSWDVLEDDEERELIEQIDYTPEEILKNRYKNLLLRERRLQKKSLEYKEKSKNNQKLILGSVTKIKGTNGRIKNKTITIAEAEFNVLKIYETELTKIQTQQIKLAVELKKMITEVKSADNEVVDDWVTAVLEDE